MKAIHILTSIGLSLVLGVIGAASSLCPWRTIRPAKRPVRSIWRKFRSRSKLAPSDN